jgi:hypothetical protein
MIEYLQIMCCNIKEDSMTVIKQTNDYRCNIVTSSNFEDTEVSSYLKNLHQIRVHYSRQEKFPKY